MYRDNTLMPSEAVRLLALGILAGGEQSYASLAAEIRHFTGRIVGPSLELVAQPLELLKVEGLIEPVAASGQPKDAGLPDDAALRITEAGRSEMHRLLASNIRSQVNDLNKLIVALKMRFLHLLPAEEQQVQVDLLSETVERELARLLDLRRHHDSEPGRLPSWLDLEITQTRSRLAWFEELAETLG